MKQFQTGTLSRSGMTVKNPPEAPVRDTMSQGSATPATQKGAPLQGRGPVAASMGALRGSPRVNYAPGMALEPGSAAVQVRDGHTTEDARTYDDPRLREMYGTDEMTMGSPVYYPLESNTGIQGVKKDPHGYAGAFDGDYQRRKR
jgi:hypothetical protein